MSHGRMFTILTMILVLGIWGCSKEQKVEGPLQERVERNLVPPKVEQKGDSFTVQLDELKVITMIDSSSKEIVETPNLRGQLKIVNTSKDILDFQGMSLEYLDESGKAIAFKNGEKSANPSMFFKAIKPGEFFVGNLDTTIPRAALKTLRNIAINLVYIPSPLKRVTLTLPERVG